MDHLVTGRIRKEAWKKKAYACMGGGEFKIGKHPTKDRIILSS